jgi:hypothetical protein
MATKETPVKQQEHPQGQEGREAQEPGLFESIGSFPVWLLKLIQIVTPDFLISKNPPKKNYRI